MQLPSNHELMGTPGQSHPLYIDISIKEKHAENCFTTTNNIKE